MVGQTIEGYGKQAVQSQGGSTLYNRLMSPTRYEERHTVTLQFDKYTPKKRELDIESRRSLLVGLIRLVSLQVKVTIICKILETTT